MSRKALGGIVASVLGLVVACAAGATLLFGSGTGRACAMPPPSAALAISAPPGGWRPVGRFDAEQVGHAATIATAGMQKGVPIRGWIIAVATALQESDLRNLPGGPDDSIGLFQQRPSQGWGTPQQLADPAYAAGKFYDKLLTITNWQTMALTDAAQAVQVSAYPSAYAKHEPDATLLVNAVGSGNWRAIPEDLEQCPSNCLEILSRTPAGLRNDANAAIKPDPSSDALTPRLLKISRQDVARIARNGRGSALRIAQDLPEPTNAVGSGIWRTIPVNLEQCVSTAGWTAPVHAPIVSGFRTSSRPGHDGVDLGAPRGTPILAASGGAVVVVRCNVAPEGLGCNRDGSPSVPGCGWYVDIRHVGDVFTRYCHMLTRPAVAEGQQVLAGQVIGVVGSSGHSSGPHLHFEVHLGDRTSSTAVDPVIYLRDRGVTLGGV